jgi:hypothetical protein
MPDFLAVYDYGTGGIWVILRALNEQEITAKYPELTVVKDRPAWMTDAVHDKIRENLSFDVDKPPTGWLLTLVQERPSRP